MANKSVGKIWRIAPQPQACNILLADIDPVPQRFVLKLDHPNYNALFSLALAAATNAYDVTVFTEAEIDPAQDAVVIYMHIDWNR